MSQGTEGATKLIMTLREEYGLSYQEVADICRVSVSVVTQWLGDRGAKTAVLARPCYARLLELELGAGLPQWTPETIRARRAQVARKRRERRLVTTRDLDGDRVNV